MLEKWDIGISDLVPEVEMETAEVILSNFQFCSKSGLLFTVMVPEVEMETVEVILSNFQFC